DDRRAGRPLDARPSHNATDVALAAVTDGRPDDARRVRVLARPVSRQEWDEPPTASCWWAAASRPVMGNERQQFLRTLGAWSGPACRLLNDGGIFESVDVNRRHTNLETSSAWMRIVSTSAHTAHPEHSTDHGATLARPFAA